MPARKKSSISPLDPAISNLEMKGERLKVFSLQTLLTNKQRRETRDAARLGDVLIPWYESTVSKPAAKLEGIAELWQEHVPTTIAQRSRLVGFHRGTLTVSLDSTTVRAELDTQLRSGLLRTLQSASRGALYRVKCCVQAPISIDKGD
jgi:Dna[CI] antecedent, DciA